MRRRTFVTAVAGLPILRLAPEIEPTAFRSHEPSTVRDETGRPIPWQELADDLARMERNAVEDEFPRTWDRKRYDDLIRWSDEVLLIFGFGSVAWSDATVEGHIVYFEEAAEVVAVGWSDDFRAWTMFVRARLLGDWQGRTPHALTVTS
jgi:hypothetical protein